VTTVFHFADLNLMQLVLVCAVAFIISVISGISGYGAGLVLPVFLAPLVGVTNVIPIMAIVMLMNNFGRMLAFWDKIEWSHARLILSLGLPACIAGAWSYTLLSSRWVALLLGLFLLVSVPLRRMLHQTSYRLSPAAERGAGAFFGFVNGGMAGTGVILVSIMMSAGLHGAALIATDGIIAVIMAIAKIALFSGMAKLGPDLAMVGLLVGISTAPGGFIARRLLAHIPMHVHAWVMEAVIVIGAVTLLLQAVW